MVIQEGKQVRGVFVFAILIKDAAILVDDGYDVVIAELVIIVVITANAAWIDGCRAAIRFL